MTWPLIERELRVALRKHHVTRVRIWGTVICAAITALFLIIGSGSGKQWGKELNWLLFWGGLVIILRIPGYTVGIFAEERRNQTLGLLFLCGLGPWELFASKTLGSALVSLSILAILYPFFAISFLGGGVTIEWFVAVVCCLPVLLLFVFAICILASVLCREESTAMVVAVALACLLCLTTPVIQTVSVKFSDGQPLAREWLLLSPALPAYRVAHKLTGGAVREFWTSSAISVTWSLAALLVAGIVLRRVWQIEVDSAAPASWRVRAAGWLRGSFEWRRRLARVWLERNPFTWLAARDRWPTSLAWLVVGALSAIWLAGWMAWPKHWPSVANFFITAVLLNTTLHWLSLYGAAKQIGEDRRSGALELLLTSPLSEGDIIRGQFDALRLQFRPVCFTVVGLNLAMMLAGFLLRDWNWRAVTVYLLLWGFLIYWPGRLSGSFRFALPVIWDSLNCGRPAYAAWRASGLTGSPYYLGWLGFNLLRGMKTASGLNRFPSGSVMEFVVIWIILLLIWLARIAQKNAKPDIEGRLLRDFRSVAQEPVPEPSDPRFKKWQPGERFPVRDPLGEHLIRRTLKRVS